MSRLPEHVIDEVRARVDIYDVVSRYVDLKRSGRRFKGLCPFHAEKTPSFHVDREQQLFYCFGCQAGGNVFNFVMRLERAPFVDVVRRLAEEAGIPIELVESSPEEVQRRREREALFQATEAAAEFYVRNLFSHMGAKARAYLKGRGLNQDVVRTFQIGYAPNSWHALQKYLVTRGIEIDVALKAGLLGRGRRGPFDWLRDRIVFPIIDVYGRVVGFGGRLLEGDGPKYLNTSESPLFSKGTQLYGLNVAKESLTRGSRLVLVEGYMDVVCLYRHGFAQVVASLGTAFTRQQARLIRRYTTDVVVAYDADVAGQSAAMRGIELLNDEGINVAVASLPQGYDPDSYVQEHGLESFRRIVDTSAPLIEYKLNEAIKKADLETVEGKVRAVEAALPILLSIESAVGREGYIEMTAEMLGVTVAALKDEVRRFQANQARIGAGRRPEEARHKLATSRYTNRDLAPEGLGRTRRRPKGPGNNRKTNPASERIERDLLIWIIQEPMLAVAVKERLGDAPFIRDRFNGLFRWILAQGDLGVTGEALVGRIDDAELAQVAGALLMQGTKPSGSFQDYLERATRDALRRRIGSLEDELNQLIDSEDMTRVKVGRLLVRYIDLRDQVNGALGQSKVS